MKKIHLLYTALFACIFFFAGCKNEEYVVTFNSNGGKGALITQNFTGKVAQPLMANSFTNEGFVFSSWNTKPNGTGTSYADEEKIKVSGHFVLYAQWTKATGEFTVTFNANGGKGDMPPQKFQTGVTQPISPNMFIYENYGFLGWCTAPNGKGKHYSNEQNISISADMTLYAQWEIYYNTVFVFFDANGGTGTMEPQAFLEGVAQMLDTNKFTRTDFTFIGWNTKKDGTGYSLKDNEECRIYNNLRLFAQWMINPKHCTVRYLKDQSKKY